MASYKNIVASNDTYTIDQFIQLKDADSITYANYSIFERSIDNSNLVYAIDNLIYYYMDEINSMRKIVAINENERQKYMYKPKLLSYDCYGTTEAYFFLLAMNGQCNLKEFDLADGFFYALTPQDLLSFANSIKNAESQYITMNRTNLNIYES